jgi:hypothetical protein
MFTKPRAGRGVTECIPEILGYEKFEVADDDIRLVKEKCGVDIHAIRYRNKRFHK